MGGETTRDPCISYDSKFEHSKLEKAQLSQTWDGRTKKEEIPSIYWRARDCGIIICRRMVQFNL